MIYWPPKHLTPRLRVEAHTGRMHLTIHDAKGREYPEIAEKFSRTLIVLSKALLFLVFGLLSLAAIVLILMVKP